MFEYIWVAFLIGQAIGMGFIVRALALSGMRTSMISKRLGRIGLIVALLDILVVLGPVWNGFWILGALGYLLSISWILSLAIALKWPHRKRIETFVLSTGV